MKKKVLIIAPGRKTRGGITSVVKEYENSTFWNENGCKWIETYIDRSKLSAILYFIRAYIIFLFYLPFSKIIHIHLSGTSSVLRKSFFFIPSYWLGKKLIVHLHAFSTESSIRSKHKNRYRKLFVNSDVIIVLSEYWKKEVISAFGNKIKISIVHNPCSAKSIVSNSENGTKKEPYILYAGTLEDRKGYKDLIQAFSIIHRKHQNWKLVFAGNGNIDEGIELATRENVESSVIFAGWVSGQEKERLFNEASVFCLPSYYEGFPMAVLDAISFGLPVITTPVGGIMDAFRDNENAIIFDPGDIYSLSNKISLLIENEQLRKEIALASYELSQTIFSIEETTSLMNEIYQNLVIN